MPTGYTYNIIDGISFDTFALNCARAFGVCVELRDEPAGGEIIPEVFVPSTHNLDAANKAKEEFINISNMTYLELKEKCDLEYEESEKNRIGWLNKRNTQLSAYEKMLEEVFSWNPPTPEHNELKNFMIKQIEDSIKFDCNINYYNTPTERQTPDEWLSERKSMLEQNIKYHLNAYNQEVERTNKKNAWISALRESLKTKDNG